MSGPRALAALLVALGLATTALLRLVPAAAASWARAALLLALPLAVGAAGTLLVERRRRRPFPAEVAVPSLKYLPFVLVLLALDIAPVAFGAMAGQFAFVEGAATLSGLRAVAILFGLPAVIFVWTVGWEWGLRARLYAPWADAGRPRRAFALSVIAGTALSLPALAPGFAAPERNFVLAGLVAAAVREAIAVRLFRRAGMLLSGTFRGLAAGFEALVAADRMSYWAPIAGYFAVVPEAQWLRLAGPLAAAVLAWGVLGALDRRDARRRREP
jgi:hypothetical protein